MHYHWYYFAELNHRRYNVHRDETRNFKLTVQSQYKDSEGVRRTEKERSFFSRNLFLSCITYKVVFYT